MNAELEDKLFSLNQAGMTCLEELEPIQAFSHLTHAESLLKQHKVPSTDRLWGVTLNNLGCYYQHVGKQSMALHYHERALHMAAVDATDHLNLAGVYMNLLNLHFKARDHSKAMWAGTQAQQHLRPYAQTHPLAQAKLHSVQRLLHALHTTPPPARARACLKSFEGYGLRSPIKQSTLASGRKHRTCASMAHRVPRLKATEVPLALSELAARRVQLRKSRREKSHFLSDKLRSLRQVSLTRELKAKLSATLNIR